MKEKRVLLAAAPAEATLGILISGLNHPRSGLSYREGSEVNFQFPVLDRLKNDRGNFHFFLPEAFFLHFQVIIRHFISSPHPSGHLVKRLRQGNFNRAVVMG
jgi:hypothetical protein